MNSPVQMPLVKSNLPSLAFEGWIYFSSFISQLSPLTTSHAPASISCCQTHPVLPHALICSLDWGNTLHPSSPLKHCPSVQAQLKFHLLWDDLSHSSSTTSLASTQADFLLVFQSVFGHLCTNLPLTQLIEYPDHNPALSVFLNAWHSVDIHT